MFCEIVYLLTWGRATRSEKLVQDPCLYSKNDLGDANPFQVFVFFYLND